MAKCLLIILAKYPEAGFAKTRLARIIGDSSAAKLYEAVRSRRRAFSI